MAKFRGTIRKSDLEGGHWQLEADDGTHYVLEEATSQAAKGWSDGQRVELDGAVDRNVMSFAMTGPTLKVRATKTL